MAKARGKGKCGCVVTVGTTTQDDINLFDLHRTGWGKAKRAAMKLAKDTGRLALVNIRCADGSMPVYQCDWDRRADRMRCTVEEFGPDIKPKPVAGLDDCPSGQHVCPDTGKCIRIGSGRGGNSSRRRRKKRTGPLTPQQKRFKAAAEACKGKPGYRECVAGKLRK